MALCDTDGYALLGNAALRSRASACAGMPDKCCHKMLLFAVTDFTVYTGAEGARTESACSLLLLRSCSSCTVQHAVWQQVDALCDKSPVCAPQRLKVQKTVSAAQLAKIQSLEEQLQRSQAQNRQLQQQLAAAEAANQQ